MEVVPNLLKVHGNNIGEVVFSTNVAGTTFIKDSRELLSFLKSFPDRKSIELSLVREPENPYDVNAVRVDVSISGRSKKNKLGYIPKDIAKTLSYVLSKPDEYQVDVLGVEFVGGVEEKENIGVFFQYRIIDLSSVSVSEDGISDYNGLDLNGVFDFESLD